MAREHKFSVWIARPITWYKRDGRSGSGWSYQEYANLDDHTPRVVAKNFTEPVEAADVAEEYLEKFGIPGVTYAELRFNGDKEPHTIICYMEDEILGVFNAPSAKWPMFYPEGSGTMLDGLPTQFSSPDGEKADEADDETPSSGFGDENENSKTMDLSNDGTDDDEGDDDEIEDEDEPEAEDGPDEEDGPGEPESDDDADDDDFTEDENDDEADEDEGDEGDEEDGDGELDEDSENGDAENDNEDDEEEEMELPRLRLFAKMRGPLGWRKRADLEELSDRNVFAMKVGVLRDEDGLTRAQEERDTFLHVEYVEKDENRASGLLRLRLPDNVTLDDFKQQASGWITAEVPMPRNEDA